MCMRIKYTAYTAKARRRPYAADLASVTWHLRLVLLLPAVYLLLVLLVLLLARCCCSVKFSPLLLIKTTLAHTVLFQVCSRLHQVRMSNCLHSLHGLGSASDKHQNAHYHNDSLSLRVPTCQRLHLLTLHPAQQICELQHPSPL